MAVSHVFSNAQADWTGTVTVGNSAGQATTVEATNIVRPADWNSGHNQFYTLTSNTTGNSTASGTNVIWAAAGINSIGGSTGSVVISGPPYGSAFQNFPTDIALANGSSFATTKCYVIPFQVEYPINVSFFEAFFSVNVATAANNSSAYQDVTLRAVIYTRNASTLTSITSFSNSFTQTHTSNATGTVTGIKRLTQTLNPMTINPGEYWIGVNLSTNNTATGGANTTALTFGVSPMQMTPGPAGTFLHYKNFGGQSNASQQINHGGGYFASANTAATIGLSDVTMATNSSDGHIILRFMNATYQ